MDDINKQRDAARKLLGLHKALPQKVPQWLFNRLKLYWKAQGNDVTSVRTQLLRDVLTHVSGTESGNWLDHWGITKAGSYQCCNGAENFIADPYDFGSSTAKSLDAFCQALGLTWHVTSDSWWYPGSTVRITIHPKDV